MPLKYNFALKNNELQRWEPRGNIERKKTTSFKEKIELLKKYIKNNPLLFYPQFATIFLVILIQILNLYPSFIVRRLKPKHEEYIFVVQRIKRIKTDIKKFKKELNDLKPNFTLITPTYLFTFYIQNSMPINIKLKKYKLNKNFFFLEAESYTLKAINEMITLLIESPIIDEKSVSIKRIKRKADKDSTFSLEIAGKILKTNIDSKEYLYNESSAFGLLEKLLRFKKTNMLLK
ncbi:hypothetical protein PMT9312_1192 [Prochlorococcus marinus str. MIT 9312]|uniref:Uncharacterized protein n=1 Tax=Prochlorococcus marinus (strain MIT 9312) TaxID=74546 RepID=Q31A44_PROM9|nr:hypothetical protein [Prochlorococcus marinus]ABB50251.1 hypothetical protein PMT9312_1192 [Prochlorococcus marinus str. MIT 9312]KGF99819.1 hypothetical protein EU97_0953 [Prochlorococcus marinus str. MIT 9311]